MLLRLMTSNHQIVNLQSATESFSVALAFITIIKVTKLINKVLWCTRLWLSV